MAKPRRPVDSDDEEYKPQIVVLENSNVTQADIATCKASATEEDEGMCLTLKCNYSETGNIN